MNKRRSTLVVCLIAATLALLLMPRAESTAPANDFAFYWTAAKLVLDGKNPYSPRETSDLQNRLSFPGKGRLVMLNPPWALPLVAPFGLVSFATGKSAWLLIGLALIFIAVHWLWDLYGGVENRWIGWLVAATFLPVAIVLAIGQMGPLILFGLAGYLRFESERSSPISPSTALFSFFFSTTKRPLAIHGLRLPGWFCTKLSSKRRPPMSISNPLSSVVHQTLKLSNLSSLLSAGCANPADS